MLCLDRSSHPLRWSSAVLSLHQLFSYCSLFFRLASFAWSALHVVFLLASHVFLSCPLFLCSCLFTREASPRLTPLSVCVPVLLMNVQSWSVLFRFCALLAREVS